MFVEHSISRKSHALSSSCNIDHFVVQLILRLRDGDYFISTMFSSKHQDLQKILFGEMIFYDDFRKILKRQNDVKENDDCKNAKICKICKDINYVI